MHVWLVLGLTEAFFNFFSCSHDFIMQKVYLYLAVNACLHWLNNVSGV
jgi:hypothetical protein